MAWEIHGDQQVTCESAREPGPRSEQTPQCGLLGGLQAESVKAQLFAVFGT